MNLLISFSGRKSGSCDQIAQFIAGRDDAIIYFRDLNVHPCSGCGYDCFAGECKYRSDAIYHLYEQMSRCEKTFLIVPMYCAHPSSLYFLFSERSQDYFMHNDNYAEIIRRLYIIGIYGSAAETPDFIPCLEKWFLDSPLRNHVLGIERHRYGLKLNDCILSVSEAKEALLAFAGL